MTLPPLLPLLPEPAQCTGTLVGWPSDGLEAFAAPAAAAHAPGWAGRRAGPALGPDCSASLDDPDPLVTCAEVAAESPGHHAISQPSATVATTSCPLSSTSVTAVTPEATRPSTRVYAPSAVVDVCVCTTFCRSPELVPPTVTDDMPPAGAPEPRSRIAPLTDCALAVEPSSADTWVTSVKDELVKQAAYAPAFWNSATVNGPRTSVSTVCQLPEPS